MEYIPIYWPGIALDYRESKLFFSSIIDEEINVVFTSIAFSKFN